MLENYGFNQIRAVARANILNREAGPGRGDWRARCYNGFWFVGSVTALEAFEKGGARIH